MNKVEGKQLALLSFESQKILYAVAMSCTIYTWARVVHQRDVFFAPEKELFNNLFNSELTWIIIFEIKETKVIYLLTFKEYIYFFKCK